MAQPEKTFRMGFVSASVFVNDYEVNDSKRKTRRSRRNVVLQRSYKEGDEWKLGVSLGTFGTNVSGDPCEALSASEG